MASQNDVNTPLLALIGFLGSILVFAIIVLLTVVYYEAEEREEYVKNISQPYAEVDNLLASQQARLVEYRWVDEKNQVVAIPIQRAMQLVVAQRGSDSKSERSPQGGKDSAQTETSSTTGTTEGSAPRGGEAAAAPAGGDRTQ
jgi:hypothetical protein